MPKDKEPTLEDFYQLSLGPKPTRQEYLEYVRQSGERLEAMAAGPRITWCPECHKIGCICKKEEE